MTITPEVGLLLTIFGILMILLTLSVVSIVLRLRGYSWDLSQIDFGKIEKRPKLGKELQAAREQNYIHITRKKRESQGEQDD